MLIMKTKITTYSVVTLAILLILLVIGSWLVSILFPSLEVRSMISGEGARWFLGTYSSFLASAPTSWMVIIGVTWGVMSESGMIRCVADKHRKYRERLALYSAIVLFSLYVIAVALLSVVPHAVLLSADGNLFPSPFSRSIIPMSCFGLFLSSAIFGIISGNTPRPSDVVSAMLSGITSVAPILVIWLFLSQFVMSLRFVLG